jgi:aryl-alcohol dehydrogenase-like predicted oxidoreductase
MRTRRLGRTGLVVGELGLGTRGFTCAGFDASDARRIVSHAIERGVDLIDAWREPELERAVGDAVRDLRARDRVVVATKVAPLRPHGSAVEADIGTELAGEDRPSATRALHRVFPAGHVQDQVERALRASRLEVLPVAVLHAWFDTWLDDTAWPELRGALERLVREGKVLHWGVADAGGGPDGVVRALAEPVLAIVVTEYNLFERGPDAALFAAARAHDTGVIVRTPLADGALGGDLAAGATFPATDPRAATLTAERLAEVAVRLARLAAHVAETPPAARSTDPAREALEAAEAARRGAELEARTIAELALRFALANAAGGAVVAGMRAREHVDANLAASDGRALSAALLEQLAAHAWPRAA